MAASFGRTRLLMTRFPNSHDYMPVAWGLAVVAAAAVLLGAQTAGGPAVSERARALHASSLVFDGHIHAVDREFYQGRAIGPRKPDAQFGPPRAQDGGLCATFL